MSLLVILNCKLYITIYVIIKNLHIGVIKIKFVLHKHYNK